MKKKTLYSVSVPRHGGELYQALIQVYHSLIHSGGGLYQAVIHVYQDADTRYQGYTIYQHLLQTHYKVRQAGARIGYLIPRLPGELKLDFYAGLQARCRQA